MVKQNDFGDDEFGGPTESDPMGLDLNEAFIIQYHGYIGLGERSGAMRPESLPFSWREFVIWWERTPVLERNGTIDTLRNYV